MGTNDLMTILFNPELFKKLEAWRDGNKFVKQDSINDEWDDNELINQFVARNLEALGI